MSRRVVLFATIALSSLALSLFAAEIYPKASRKKERLDADKIVSILDQLQAEEQELLQALEEVKSELAIVKVRASTVQSQLDCP